jgi:septal ring factor EnvC (AmiA/AmiB activator)
VFLLWESLRCQKRSLAEANERLAQQSTEAADLWMLCAELRTDAASARAEAAPFAVRVRQLEEELDRVIGQRDQLRGQAAEASSRAETLAGRLAKAGTLAACLAMAVAVEVARSSQVEGSKQKARANGMFLLARDSPVRTSPQLCLCVV